MSTRKRVFVCLWQGLAWLHVDQALRDIDLVVRLQHHVGVRFPFFDHLLQVDCEILAVLSGDLNLALVREIPETTGANDGLAHGVSFVSWDFLRSLPADRTIDINLAARFLADA